MKKLTCIIVDDEPVARKVIREFVDQVPFLDFRGQFENVSKAETFLRTQQADLLFLDIEMPKRTGLDYLKTGQVKPLVILTTAFPNYALEGYELDIIDYLLKPIAFARFLKAVQKVKDYLELRDATINDPFSEYLFVRSDKRIEKVALKDILYIESLGNYVTIYTENKKIVAYLTMKGLEAQLPSQRFIKIHQSFLVALSKIDAIEGNMIRIGRNELPISRNYRLAVMQLIEQRMLKR